MSLGRSMLEIARALCVLGLIFLNFGHVPAIAAPGDGLTLSMDASFCGTPLDDDAAHAPCHACRIGGGADLAPPCPELVAPIPVAIALADAPEVFGLVLHLHGPAGPRAPPAA